MGTDDEIGRELDEQEAAGADKPAADGKARPAKNPGFEWCGVANCLERAVREGLCKIHAIKAHKGHAASLKARRDWHAVHDPAPATPAGNAGWRYSERSPAAGSRSGFQPLSEGAGGGQTAGATIAAGTRQDAASTSEAAEQNAEKAVVGQQIKCSVCGRHCADLRGMGIHMAARHGMHAGSAKAAEPKKDPHPCPQCGLVCAGRSGLGLHMARKHGVRGTFKAAKDASKVARAAAEAGGLTCPECGQRCATYGGLASHRRRKHGVTGMVHGGAGVDKRAASRDVAVEVVSGSRSGCQPLSDGAGDGETVGAVESVGAAESVERGMMPRLLPEKTERDETPRLHGEALAAGVMRVLYELGLSESVPHIPHADGQLFVCRKSGRAALVTHAGEVWNMEIRRACLPA